MCRGSRGFALGPCGYLDTNMLVSATPKSRVGGIVQHKALTRVVSRCSGIMALVFQSLSCYPRCCIQHTSTITCLSKGKQIGHMDQNFSN